MVEIVPLLDARAQVGEGTTWDPEAGVLWWLDIWGKTIHRYHPDSGKNDTFHLPEMPGCLGLRAKGGLVISMASGFYFFDPESGRLEFIVNPESHIAETRFNDGKTDRFGRFWSGTTFEAPPRKPERIGSLYRLDADLTAHRMVEGIGSSNGLAWSPDGKVMYFADSYGGAVWAFDVDTATGDVANRRVFIDTTTTGAFADGATVDADGCYWVTIPLVGKVNRYDPSGKLMQTIHMPVESPTCCEFGGPNLDILYVTSGTLNESAERLAKQTMPGGLFAVYTGAKGLELPPFLG
jgi:sugar lactone lactonase YvrE